MYIHPSLSTPSLTTPYPLRITMLRGPGAWDRSGRKSAGEFHGSGNYQLEPKTKEKIGDSAKMLRVTGRAIMLIISLLFRVRGSPITTIGRALPSDGTQIRRGLHRWQ